MEHLSLIASVSIALLVMAIVAKAAVVVPQQNAYVVEYLGRYSRTLRAGFYILIPFVERVAYRHSLKEHAVDIGAQVCITRDNVKVSVDGILYMQVLDPERASYGIDEYQFAVSQLAMTLLRSEFGRIELDRTFLERAMINGNVVKELDQAADPWGVKILRYEIQSIEPSPDVVSAMEKQMRAEREKRAVVLESEGRREAIVNDAEGRKQQLIRQSEGARQMQINEAEGQAAAIVALAAATAEGLRHVAEALTQDGGDAAMQLRIAEQYVEQFGELAKESNTLVVPANLSDISSMVALATKVARNGAGAPAAGSG